MTDAEFQKQFTLNIPITIRTLKRDDLPLLEWHGQFSHLRILFRRSFREQLRGHRQLLIACSNDLPIARLFIQFDMHARSNTSNKRGYLYSFHVHEMFRGYGIGTRLIQSAEAILNAKHYTSVSIAVAKENPRARKLYQRHGFQVYGEDPGKWKYRDHTGKIRVMNEPCWLLEKTLQLR